MGLHVVDPLKLTNHKINEPAKFFILLYNRLFLFFF